MTKPGNVWMSLIILAIGLYFANLWLNFTCDLNTRQTVDVGGQQIQLPQIQYPKPLIPLICSMNSLENFVITIIASAFTFTGAASVAKNLIGD